jgi:thioredoxin family protein
MAQLRIPLDSTRFSKGMTWKEYMAQMGDTRQRTEDNYNKATLSDDERKFFSSVTGVRHVLMLAENWCGDVHRNSPLVARIVEAIPGAELRVFLRDQNLDITDCFLNNGYRSIPVVVFFDQDWNEIGRWIERAHPATGKAALIRSKTLDVAPKDDKAKQDAAMNDFRAQVNAEYAVAGFPLWRAAVAEVRTLLETKLGKK